MSRPRLIVSAAPDPQGAAPTKPACTAPQSDAALHPAGVVASRACKLLVFPRWAPCFENQ